MKLCDVTNIVELANGEARSQIPGALEELLPLTDFLDALRGRRIARPLCLYFFFLSDPGLDG